MSNWEPLSSSDKARFEWQIDTPGFGIERQEKLKNATVLISRLGGVGSVVAYELAAAGIGNMYLAHGGNVKPSDLNRQLLMTHDWLDKPRIESVERRLHDLNPDIHITAIPANICEENVAELVAA
ncbi:MAG: ThiF family adenylyltransferase, partial [Planctomycetes bacterium]|nr:ThiF family adenylyltransferase [Planctomycetota bacterium]